MCRRCSINHKIDAPICIVGASMVIGFGWALRHSYTGEPFIEAFMPVMVIAGLFALVGILVGIAIWRWEQRS